jgi:hypothetical protein
MTDISKRFEQLVLSSQKKLVEKNQILPVKVSDGILVGDVLIASNGHLKNLYKKNKLIYTDISLNDVAIKLANLLALNQSSILADQIYRADQEYGKYFTEWQQLKEKYRSACKNNQNDRADILLVKYEESRNKAQKAKNNALGLIKT